jgi:FeS assembly SUF system protein
MSLLKLGLNEIPVKETKKRPKIDEREDGGTGLNTGALSSAPSYSDYVPSMHSNMTMTSPLPPVEPEYGPDATLEEKVVAVLKTCYDPEIPVDIYQLGLIYKVFAPRAEGEPGKVKVLMTLTAPNCPAAQTLPAEAKYKIERLNEVDDAEIEITFDPPWTPEKMSEEAKLVLNLI